MARDTGAEHFMTYKEFIKWVVPMWATSIAVPILTAVYIVNVHEQRPHDNAASIDQFVELRQDLKEQSKDIDDLRKAVSELSRTVAAAHGR